MGIEVFIVVALFSAVSGAVMWFSAKSRFQQASQMATEKSAELQTQCDEYKSELGKLGESLRALQLSEQSAASKSEELLKRKAELEDELKSLKEKSDETAAQFHEADSQRKAIKAELEQKNLQQEEIKEAVRTYQTQLKEERTKIETQQETQSRLNGELKAIQASAQELENNLTEAREKIQQLEQQLEASRNAHNILQDAFTKQKTSIEERESSHQRELKQFEEQKAKLSEEFKLLANEILEAKTKNLQASSKISLNTVLSPFQQSIDSFKKEVQEIHHRETAQQGQLRQELENLKQLNMKITTEAHELSTALRGQKKLQGNWGELILENVLERSGLQLGKDYKREVSLESEDGRQRPDAIVYLPQGKHLIIDAKVSLNAYTRYVNGEDEAERMVALKEHIAALANHITTLADRNYFKLSGLNSPEMVFMFVPIESAFVEALKADETLFSQAIERNVLVATPTTLLTSLNIVRQLWRYEDQNKHTAALAQKAEGVFKKLNNFLQSFQRVKAGLETATDAYVKAEGQLVSGRGSLVKQVGEFKNLAPSIQAELPAYFAEKADLEIDFVPAEGDEEAQVLPVEDGEVEVLEEQDQVPDRNG